MKVTKDNINEVVRAFLKGKPGVRHDKTKAEKVNAFYHHRSCAKTGQWTDVFQCPVCHRETRQLANYLGGRSLFCDGIRWVKEKPVAGPSTAEKLINGIPVTGKEEN